MQTRCVYCGTEHYALAVVAISYGHAKCGRCGRTPPVYTDREQYRRALREARG